MIQLNGVFKAFGEEVVLNGVSLRFEEGKITALLGESGVGKSTLLQAIANLTEYGGSIENRPERISYLFQDSRLLPNLTVRQNLDFVLKGVMPDREERSRRITDMLKEVELLAAENKYPQALSGGMKQRVSLARAFLYPSPLLLMDEPFSGLDIRLKSQLIALLERLLAEDARTVIFVTHDVDEVLLIADRVLFMKKTGIVDLGSIDIPQSQRSVADASLLPMRKKIAECFEV